MRSATQSGATRFTRLARNAIVVDASAALEVLLERPRADWLLARMRRAGALDAPHLIDIEIAHVLRRYQALGDITATRGASALRDLASWRLHRYPHAGLLARIWALRANLTAYDAAYVALAETLDAPLLTADARLARAPGHDARVIVPPAR